MNRRCSLTVAAAVCVTVVGAITSASRAADEVTTSVDGSKPVISIETEHAALTLFVGSDGRLYQLGFGKRGEQAKPPGKVDRRDEFYPASGDGFVREPALQITHADGATSTDLVFDHVDGGPAPANDAVLHTRIYLRDPHYPLFVTLHFMAYENDDVIEQWATIRHDEDQPVVLGHYASSAPLLRGREYWLTQLHGDYKREATLAEERLGPGIKVIDSKIGVRATRFANPSFFLSLGGPAKEEAGEVFAGALAWSGSFQLAFELDERSRLRALGGVNPFASAYRLQAGQAFDTPKLIWTYSEHGKGAASRNLHRWARRYGMRDGDKPRPVLLNNWEATHMDFDEAKIVSLFDGAAEIGADLFLLDDGWFGNAHPRDNDRAGLGDWDVNHKKLPHGLSYLADEAKKRRLAFGIWLEPEMVNPQSDLYEQHPDWAITQPYREPELSRNQLVLDLTNSEARTHALEAIDHTLQPNPGIRYVKWDANRFVTQPGSSYLGPRDQANLSVDYTRSLYKLMDHMAETYPSVMAMLCAGGGGRADYGALSRFHSFWPSDNTDPKSRVMIQWGYGHVFPASAMSAHVTRMGKRPLKFAIDVALSGAFGVDMDLSKTTPEERRQLADAIKLYHETIRSVTAQGDLYRLESPYDGPRAAQVYVAPGGDRAILFVYQLAAGEAKPVKIEGLDAKKTYRVRELSLPAGAKSTLEADGRELTGGELRDRGITPPCTKEFESSVIELTAVSNN